MSADASSSTQQSTDSYKTMEEYPASTIPDLGGHMYSRLTHTWDNPEVLKAMSLDMPIVEFPAEVAEPEFPLLPVRKPETPEEHLKTRRTLTLLSITTGLGEIRSEEETSPSTLKKPELDISNTSSTSVEESDPFQRLLHALKNSPRSTKQPQIEEMSEDKRPSGSRPKVEPTAEEAVIGTTVLVQVVAAEKEVKVALPRAFTRHQKDVKKFLREVQLYIALNSRAFTMDQAKKIFFLFYMTDGPGEFWKNNKTDLLLAFDPEAEKVL
ncbi:hypothetical protein Moror_2903 [Moniliophthora roreri MCA 2997]|uniref:Reverse transcriptase-rnase h-integrase n=1 Tax=Moniliophthora roreri (strain MCA 2997) TaxID=1381753 RepID=V2YHR3_MONRO|nr:hypothetical protein Moror_2903 [Moniliophthora roreri MCA 2997]